MTLTLVTGANGFIGRRLVQRLTDSGREVRGLVRSQQAAEKLRALGAHGALGDITAPETLNAALEGVAQVIHLAGKTHGRTLAEFQAVNGQGSANLALACSRRPSPPVLVAVSSLAAAGPSPPGAPHTEATPAVPISLYGRSKRAGELAAVPFADRAPISIVRPPVVFGPGDRDGLTLFVAVRRFGLHPVPQRRGLPLSLVFVDDLIEGLIAVAERGERLPNPAEAPSPGKGIYYLADPAVSSYADMGRMAGAALGKRVLVIRLRKYPFLIPALLGDAAAWVTSRPTLFGMDKLREASASGWVCDPSKATRDLGFQTPRPLSERFHETAAWYQQQGWL